MSYNSPIELLLSEMHTKVEKEILNAVQKVGVTVDKDELMKALAYDRNQYEEGLRDGYNQAIHRIGWISVTDRLPEQNGVYIVYNGERIFSAEYECGRSISAWTDEYEGYCDFDVTHWMPLPEPPEENY